MLKQSYIANWKNLPEDAIKIRVARPHRLLSPSLDLLNDWKKHKITWPDYETRFREEIFSNFEIICLSYWFT